MHGRHYKEDITVLKHCPSTCEKETDVGRSRSWSRSWSRSRFFQAAVGVGVGVAEIWSTPQPWFKVSQVWHAPRAMTGTDAIWYPCHTTFTPKWYSSQKTACRSDMRFLRYKILKSAMGPGRAGPGRVWVTQNTQIFPLKEITHLRHVFSLKHCQ